VSAVPLSGGLSVKNLRMRTSIIVLSLASASLSFCQSPPPLDLKNEPTVFLVGYSHLDTEWNWTYRQSILEFVPRTLRENFALFEKYPDYVFNWTGAKRYEFMKEYYPDEYAKIKQYVRQGRWIVTGSGWDECDANVPTPESIIRQVLYSNRFFKREFGVVSNNYLVPDVFGFPASLPSSLAHAGLKGISTCKLSYYPDTSSPIPFNVGRWVGPDGASVVGALNCMSYHTQVKEDLSSSPTLLKRIQDQQAKSGLQFDYTYYGTGDRGGAPETESVDWVEESKKGKGAIKIIAGGADDMFNRLTPAQRAALPSYQGELLISKHSAGTASSASQMKRWNHRNELLADAAERAAVAAQNLTGARYPQTRITDAWQRFLGGQMHDILPGTSIPQAYPFAWNDQVVALNESADVVQASVGAVASAMDTRGMGRAVVVYNPLSSLREDVVELDLAQGNQVFGPDGRPVPTQRIGSKLLFLAKVPSLGFSVFDVRTASPRALAKPLAVTPRSLENERYRVRLNEAGDVASIFDKGANREMLSAPARLAFMFNMPTKHPAWNMDWEDQQKPPSGYVEGLAKISILENGPVRVALKIEREARGSRFASVVRLTKGGNRVEFSQIIDWRTGESSLKAVFPMAASNPKATYDVGIGSIQRGNNWEKLYEGPSQRWLDLTDTSGRFGGSILSEAKYGSDKPDDRTLRLTLLYTPGIRDGYKYQGTSDWGHHEINYAFYGHSGDWRTENTPNEAARFVQPLMAFGVKPHEGMLGRSISFLQISEPSVSVMAMKKAEDSGETIVRLLERNGKPVKGVRVRFSRPILSARVVDGQENPLSEPVRVVNGGLVLDMGAYAPKALAIKFDSKSAGATSKVITLPYNADIASKAGASDGNFDGQGLAMPQELLPPSVESGGVDFKLYGSSAKNGVKADGQRIALPPGARLYFLAASAQGDRDATFLIDGKPHRLRIQAWNGFVGQWDTRLWEGSEEKPTYNLTGIQAGFVKRAPIAWYADHRRLADGSNDAYRFCYLFRYAIDLPNGAKTVTLPKDPNVVIAAATVADAPGDDARPLRPLYDTLAGNTSWKTPGAVLPK